MSNDNYKILNSDSGSVFLECESKAAIDKFFNENQGFKGRNISVVIPEGVTAIGEYAFEYCSSLTSINIPEGVTEIGEGAFAGCLSLTSTTIPDGVIGIWDCAFEDCSSLTSINIPEGVTEIGEGAFAGCSSLTEVTIPESVTGIWDCAFEDCSFLISITIPEGVAEIGSHAFAGCSSLASITIPEGVTNIERAAFWGCSSLSDINIPDGVIEIGGYAFSSCTSLTSITIPKGITEIGEDAFWGCSSLTSITIPEGVTEVGLSAFWGCLFLSYITIPGSVTEIGEDALFYCSSLELVVIPDDPKFNRIDGEFNEASFRGRSKLPNHVKLIKKSEYYSYVGGEYEFNKLSEVAKQILNKMIALSLDDALLDNNSPNKFTPEFKSNLIKNINILAIKNPKDFLAVINSGDRAFALFTDNYEKNQAGFSSSNNSLKTIDGELKKLFNKRGLGSYYGSFFKFYNPEMSKLLLCTRPNSLPKYLQNLVSHELKGVQNKVQKLQSVFQSRSVSNQNQINKQCEPSLKRAKLG